MLQVKSQTVVNTPLMVPLIRVAISNSGDGHLLAEHGGPLKLSKSWVRAIMRKLKLSYRKATTAAQKLPADWELIGKQFALR